VVALVEVVEDAVAVAPAAAWNAVEVVAAEVVLGAAVWSTAAVVVLAPVAEEAVGADSAVEEGWNMVVVLAAASRPKALRAVCSTVALQWGLMAGKAVDRTAAWERDRAWAPEAQGGLQVELEFDRVRAQAALADRPAVSGFDQALAREELAVQPVELAFFLAPAQEEREDRRAASASDPV
jgi:hypothetical protein